MDNIRGALLMVLAMTGFALEDMIVKVIAPDMPVWQIIALIGLLGTFPPAIMELRKNGLPTREMLTDKIVLMRGVFEVVSALGYVTAVTLIPLAMISSLIQAVPLAVTFGAAVFFGEKVGWRRYSAILAGFAGVLIIIRPGMQSFDPNALFGVIAVAGLAGRDLATRAIKAHVSTNFLTAQAFLFVFVAGLIMAPFAAPAAPITLKLTGLLLAATVLSVVGVWAVIAAMRVGDISFVAPFRYTRLIILVIAGMLFFDEIPDLWTIVGATIVVGSGAFSFFRERKLARGE